MKLPATAPPITVLIDSREITPWEFAGMQTETVTLATGDVSLKSLSHVVRIERKGSIQEVAACCGRERERFQREVDRLLAYPVRALIIEASWLDVERGEWRGKITPAQMFGSLIGWQCQGLSVVMAGSRQRAERIATAMLNRVASRRWRELRSMARELGNQP